MTLYVRKLDEQLSREGAAESCKEKLFKDENTSSGGSREAIPISDHGCQ